MKCNENKFRLLIRFLRSKVCRIGEICCNPRGSDNLNWRKRSANCSNQQEIRLKGDWTAKIVRKWTLIIQCSGWFLLALIEGVVYARCHPDQQIVTSPVTIGENPLVIKCRLSAPYHFNILRIAVPPDCRSDLWSLYDEKGNTVVIQAILTTKHGSEHLFTQSGGLAGGYVWLEVSAKTPALSYKMTYKKISITSSVPFQTSDIQWVSTDKM